MCPVFEGKTGDYFYRFGRHLPECLGEYVGHLIIVVFGSKLVEIKLYEHHAHDIFEQLGFGIIAKVLLLKEVLNFLDGVVVVADLFQDRACGFGMERFELIPPCDVTLLSFGERIAWDRPSTDVLTMYCKPYMFVGIGFEFIKTIGHSLRIQNFFAVRIGRIIGVEFFYRAIELRLVHRYIQFQIFVIDRLSK